MWHDSCVYLADGADIDQTAYAATGAVLAGRSLESRLEQRVRNQVILFTILRETRTERGRIDDGQTANTHTHTERPASHTIRSGEQECGNFMAASECSERRRWRQTAFIKERCDTHTHTYTRQKCVCVSCKIACVGGHRECAFENVCASTIIHPAPVALCVRISSIKMQHSWGHRRPTTGDRRQTTTMSGFQVDYGQRTIEGEWARRRSVHGAGLRIPCIMERYVRACVHHIAICASRAWDYLGMRMDFAISLRCSIECAAERRSF